MESYARILMDTASILHGSGMAKQSKEQTWKIMTEPTNKYCNNCKNNTAKDGYRDLCKHTAKCFDLDGKDNPGMLSNWEWDGKSK